MDERGEKDGGERNKQEEGREKNTTVDVHIPTHDECFLFSQKLIVDAHLLQYLDTCLTHSISTVLVTWKPFLLQEEDFSTECGQVVGESGTRRTSSHYCYIIVWSSGGLYRNYEKRS